MAQDVSFRIVGLHCAGCVGRAERALGAVPGVTAATVNLATGTARISRERGAAPDKLLAHAAARAGYPLRPMTAAPELMDNHLGRDLLIAAALTLPIVVLAMGGHWVPTIKHWVMDTLGQQTSWSLQLVLCTCVLAGPGRRFFAVGVPALMRKAPEMNALVALGTGAAWLYSVCVTVLPSIVPEAARGVFFETAAVVCTLILLGRWLEARVRGRAGEAIARLAQLRPAEAQVRRDDAWVTLPIEALRPGDQVQVLPGQAVPVDGDILRGDTWINEAMVTGEPVPLAKGPGDAVIGGTINGDHAIEVRATAVGEKTVLASIVRMVEDAQGAKLPIQMLIDKVTSVFVPAVLVVAALTAVIWLSFGTAADALVASVSVLIIACPCAMGLATPVSILVGTGRAAELGVLIRRGGALQTMANLDVLAFDKTGTLTKGAPVVTDASSDEALRLAASVERGSSHPLALAILAAAEARGLTLPDAQEASAQPGRGVTAQVDGSAVFVGTAAWMAQLGHATDAWSTALSKADDTGATPVLVAVEGTGVIGMITLEDTPKPNAKDVVRSLKDEGVTLALISGDTPSAAQSVGQSVGIERVVGGVLPDGKVTALRQIAGSSTVGFVGDGINDAPALAEADLGLALGTGTDVAMEAADIVLMSGDLDGVLKARRISQATMRNIRQNLGWAFGYNVALIPVAAGVLVPFGGPMLSPMLAGWAMALSSVFVVSNALRLRRAA